MTWRHPRVLFQAGFIVLVVNAVSLYLGWLFPQYLRGSEALWVSIALLLLLVGGALLAAALILWIREPRPSPKPQAPWHRRPDVFALLALLAFPAGVWASLALAARGADASLSWMQAPLLPGFALLAWSCWLGRPRPPDRPLTDASAWMIAAALALGLGLALLLFDWVESNEGMEGPLTFGLLGLVAGILAAAGGYLVARTKPLGALTLGLVALFGAWTAVPLLLFFSALFGVGGA